MMYNAIGTANESFTTQQWNISISKYINLIMYYNFKICMHVL